MRMVPAMAAASPSIVDQMLRDDMAKTLWRSLIDPLDPESPTPQRMAYDSQADVLFYGGSAGGAKTDLLIGLALTAHQHSIIFRRESKQLIGIEQRVQQILRTRKGYNSQDSIWRLPDGRVLEFGHCQHLGDEMAYQGRPHDLKAFDEITHFLEAQFRFLCGWLRSTVHGQRQRVVCAGNPPTTSEGDWIIPYWGPWLNDQHPHPAVFGELRWFAALDGKDEEVETNAPFEHKGERIEPKSRTFIPSKVEDNPYLLRTGYRATLQALPEPLRSQMLAGDFGAGRDDDPWQVIPTAWVIAAQERWKARGKPPRAQMSQLGVDVARGGRAQTVLAPRYDNFIDELKVYPGRETPDGPATASLVVAHLKSGAHAAIDVCGPGGEVYGHLNALGIAASRCDGSEPSHGRDKSGSVPFFNKRSEMWWRTREALDPDSGEEICLPPDPELRADLCAPRWSRPPRGIKVELKEETIKRIGRSPDKGDAVVYALSEEPVTNATRSLVMPTRVEREYSVHGW